MWRRRGVGALGAASFLDDVTHEVPTSLLPSLLTATLGAPAASLGLIEGVADGLAGAARLAGGTLADDPRRRRATAVGGYTAAAVLSSLIGVATAVWQVGVLRAGSWFAQGLRGPSRNALLAEMVEPSTYGRAYGFERAMDNLGAIGGPLLALALISAVSVRTAILLAVVPGLLAAAAIVVAVRAAPRAERHERQPLRLRIRPVVRSRLRPLLAGITAFEVGNVATTLLILRATELLDDPRLALVLYAGYNIAATGASLAAGRVGDARGSLTVLVTGFAAFGAAYAGLALVGASFVLLAGLFLLAGAGNGFVETGEHTAVAVHAPADLRGSAFGLVAAVQSFGNLAASTAAGAIWTLVSPRAAFLYLAAWMVVALAATAFARR